MLSIILGIATSAIIISILSIVFSEEIIKNIRKIIFKLGILKDVDLSGVWKASFTNNDKEYVEIFKLN